MSTDGRTGAVKNNAIVFDNHTFISGAKMQLLRRGSCHSRKFATAFLTPDLRSFTDGGQRA